MSPGISRSATSFGSFPRVSGDEPRVRALPGGARRFPRVSGDEPAFVAAETGAALFSPRERG